MTEVSGSQQLTIEQALAKAKKAVRQGDIDLALQLYTAVLQQQPRNPVAKKKLRRLQKDFPSNRAGQVENANPPQDQINKLVSLFQSGQLQRLDLARAGRTGPRGVGACQVQEHHQEQDVRRGPVRGAVAASCLPPMAASPRVVVPATVCVFFFLARLRSQRCWKAKACVRASCSVRARARVGCDCGGIRAWPFRPGPRAARRGPDA